MHSRVLDIAEGLRLIHDGRLVELRALGVPDGNGRTQTWSGYFDSYQIAASEALRAEDRGAEGVYQTLQSIHPGLFARSPNQWTIGPKHTTSDRDVVGRDWLFIDVDPDRPAGISSTSEEKRAAEEIRDEIARWIVGRKMFPSIIKADSGNGAHLLVSLAGVELDSGDMLARIANIFSDDAVTIDTSVGKPSQLTKLYGTLTRKGHNVSDRPWRRSSIVGIG